MSELQTIKPAQYKFEISLDTKYLVASPDDDKFPRNQVLPNLTFKLQIVNQSNDKQFNPA